MSLVILTSCSSESDTERLKSVTELRSSETESVAETPDGNLVPDKETRSYEGRGKVIRLIAGSTFIEINHEDIPGYMSAMSMLFPVADASMIHGITPDDSVRFQISGSGEILQISRIGS